MLKWAAIDRLGPDDPRAAQRRTSPARVKGLKRFLDLSDENTVPTAIIVTLRVDEKSLAPTVCEGIEGDQVYTLSLDVEEGAEREAMPGLVVDGQHRLYGMNEHNPSMLVSVVALLLRALPSQRRGGRPPGPHQFGAQRLPGRKSGQRRADQQSAGR